MILSAAQFAAQAHAGQFRKYSQPPRPYFTHVAAVAGRVAGWAQDESVVAAAFLHDVVEDCQVTFEQLTEEFGPIVSDYVRWLTEYSHQVDSREKRAVRIAMNHDYLARAPGVMQKVKLEDRLHNLEELQAAPVGFLRRYCQESEGLLRAIGSADDQLAARIREQIATLRASV